MLTVGILVGIGLRKLPSNARKLEHELSVQTGLQWKIHAVEFRKPGCVRLRGVNIIDDISTKSIFETKEIDLEKLTNKENENILLVRIPNSVLKLEHYENDDATAQVVHSVLAKLLTRFPQLSETNTQFDFEKVGIFTAHRRKKRGAFDLLQSVRGNLYRTEDGVRSDWSFELPDVSPLETQRLSIFRRNATGGSEISFRTGKIPVPVEIVAPFCPVFGRFGSGSKFSGQFSLENHSESGLVRTVRMDNVVFQKIDLAPIVSCYTNFPVTGTVDALVVRKAVFGPETFFADGAFLLADGEIDSTLFNRIVRQFDLTVAPSELPERQQESIPFEECALQFKAESEGITFWPDEDWDNVFMYRRGDSFRTESITVRFPINTANRAISYHSLLSVLAPETAPVVPLTPSLKQLFSVIPVEKEPKPNTTSRRVPTRAATSYPVIGNPVKPVDD